MAQQAEIEIIELLGGDAQCLGAELFTQGPFVEHELDVEGRFQCRVDRLDLFVGETLGFQAARIDCRGLVEIAVTDGTFVVEDAAAAIRDYADDGYDLVIGHGSQYGGSLQEIAPDFPDTVFAWGTAADTFGLDNVYAYEAASDEGGYVMGVMAAALSDSGTIGIVGPIEVGDAKLYVDGFIAGAASGGGAGAVGGGLCAEAGCGGAAVAG